MLLHHFPYNTQKPPLLEIDRAISEMQFDISRKEAVYSDVVGIYARRRAFVLSTFTNVPVYNDELIVPI